MLRKSSAPKVPVVMTPQGFVGCFKRWFMKEFESDGSGIHLATDLRKHLEMDQLGWVNLTRFINEEYGPSLNVSLEAVKQCNTVMELFDVVFSAFEVQKAKEREGLTASRERMRRNSMERIEDFKPRSASPEVSLMLDSVQAENQWIMGLDLGTQSLKCVVLSASGALVKQETVVFDAELPQFGTKGGVHCDPKVSGRVTCPSLLWVSAVDALFEKLKQDRFAFRNLVCISGGGQQHGSVYWKVGAQKVLQRLDPTQTLKDQLSNAFSVSDSPVWMDVSTDNIRKELERVVGGAMVVANLTGSRGYARFTASQMAKIAQTDAAAWKATERVSLVSSMLASLLIGSYSPIDHGDGSGMNLLDIRTLKWVKAVAEFIGPDTVKKLGDPVEGYAILDRVSPYFVHRYGLSPDCCVSAFSGDNLNALAALKLGHGGVAVSFGTSDTIFGVTDHPQPSPTEGHVFCSPLNIGEYVALNCFANGSLTREKIRDEFANGSWEVFDKHLDSVPPGCDGYIVVEWAVEEITPLMPPGRHVFHTQGHRVTDSNVLSPAIMCRAVVEGQMLRLRHHSRSLGLTETQRIVATGGGAQNTRMLQILADVFGCPVYRSTSAAAGGAAVGGAYRALHAYQRRRGAFYSFESATHHLPDGVELVCEPNMELHRNLYTSMSRLYEEICLQLIDGFF